MSELSITRDGPVATLTMNRPNRLNAFTAEMGERMCAFVDECLDGEAGDVRAVVLTGEGRAFCGGGDISVLEAIEGAPATEVHRQLLRIYATFEKLVSLPVPLVISVNGPTAGIGLGLSLAGDYIVASASATFHLAFFDRGLMPEPFTLHAMARRCGVARTRSILFGDRTPISAEEALALGLVDEVVTAGELSGRVSELASRLANGPSTAYAMAKSMLREAPDTALGPFLANGALAQTMCVGSDDFREGINSFREKRAASFVHH